jgi:hypothetical protein
MFVYVFVVVMVIEAVVVKWIVFSILDGWDGMFLV